MIRSPAVLALLLGVAFASPAQAQSWSEFAAAFPMLPCADGWAGCRVDGKIIQPDLVNDSQGNPTPASMRVGWFDLQATHSFSPFSGLSEYTGELPWATTVADDDEPLEVIPEEGDAVVDAADINAALDDEGRAAVEESRAAAAAEAVAQAERADADAAAAQAEREQAAAAERAAEQIRRQKDLEAQAAQADAAQADRLREQAAVAAAAAATAEKERQAAAAAQKRAEEDARQKTAAAAAAKRQADTKRAAEAVARKKAEEEALKKAEAEAAEARAAAKQAAAAKAAEAAEAAKAAEEAAAVAAVAIEAPAPAPVAPSTCELAELVKLEPQAMMGRMTDGQSTACEETLAAASKMTDKGKVSRLLMVNAFSKGDKDTWEQLVKRHLDEIDQSDPDLCYNYARHLAKKGASRASGVIRWADVSLENRTAWTGDTYTSRVYSLYKLRAAAAQKLWQSAEQNFAENQTDDALGDRVEKYRAMTKVMSREWYEYAKVAGKDTTKALQLCMSAAGTKDYCEAG